MSYAFEKKQNVMVLEEFQINDFLFFSVTASNLIQ